jgi:hypothetical protein
MKLIAAMRGGRVDRLGERSETDSALFQVRDKSDEAAEVSA